MKLTIMMTIYIVGTLLALLLLWLPLRRVMDPEKKHPRRVLIPILAVAVLFAFPPIGALLPDGPLCWFFQGWGNTFLGYLMFFFGPLAVAELILLPVRLVHLIRRRNWWTPGRGTTAGLLALLVLFTVGINVTGFHTSHDVKVTRCTLPLETLDQTEPLRVVLVGDLHIGVNSTPQLYRDMVDRINEQEADLVLVAGDIVTSSFGAMGDPAVYTEIFQKIQSRLGVYVVYGNHDVEEPLLGGFTFVGAENALRHPDMPGFLADCGWTLLTDELVRIPERNGLVLAGRRDESRPGDGVTERAALEELLAEVDPEEPVLLLEHEPADLEEMGALGVDLSMSGHTHNGQIFPGNIVSRIKGPQSYGLKAWGDAYALVTSGVGYYGPPIRVGTISEIMVMDIGERLDSEE